MVISMEMLMGLFFGIYICIYIYIMGCGVHIVNMEMFGGWSWDFHQSFHEIRDLVG